MNCYRVIEVGAAIVENGLILKTFQELCNPGVKLSAFITRFTGISNDMLVGKRTPEEVMKSLYEFIGQKPIIAHNAAFDSKFLVSEMRRIKKTVSNTFLCSLLLSRRLLPGLKSYKLSYLKMELKYKPLAGHCDHRALDDVLVTSHLWNYLLETLSRHGIIDPGSNILKVIMKLPKSKVFDFLETRKGYSSPVIKPECIAQVAEAPASSRMKRKRDGDFISTYFTNQKLSTTPKSNIYKIPIDLTKTTAAASPVRILRRSPRKMAKCIIKNGVMVDLTRDASSSEKLPPNQYKEEYSRRRSSSLFGVFKKKPRIQ